MNPRHAAALALMGWYLMVPPIEWSHQLRDTPTGVSEGGPLWPYPKTAPLSSWQMIMSFDTADLCEGTLSYLRKQEDKKTKAAIAKCPNDQSQCYSVEEKQRFFSALWGKCIASEDPRLKPK